MLFFLQTLGLCDADASSKINSTKRNKFIRLSISRKTCMCVFANNKNGNCLQINSIYKKINKNPNKKLCFPFSKSSWQILEWIFCFLTNEFNVSEHSEIHFSCNSNSGVYILISFVGFVKAQLLISGFVWISEFAIASHS